MGSVSAVVIQQAVDQMGALIAQEGDAREFDYLGYHCLIVRNPESGYLSGFVGIPSTHAYYGSDHTEIEGIDVHGGLEFSGNRIEHGTVRPGLWYIGFDCNHHDDLCRRDLEHLDPITFGVKRSASYKTMEYVERELHRLADQLKAAEFKRVYH